jgi:hypothetical protein
VRWTPEDAAAFEKRAEEWRKTGSVRTHEIAGSRVRGEKSPKYGNKKTELDGLKFDSKKEAGRYQELKILAAAGEITELEMQVRFDLKVNKQPVCTYIADFTYRPAKGGDLIVEDVKGVRTRDYIIKRKLMKAVYGIEVKEI